MPGAESSTDRHGLTIDIAALIASQEQNHASDFIRHSSSTKRIQLPNLLLRSASTRVIVHDLCHACFDDARAYGIHSDTRARQLEASGLGDADDRGFGCGVIGGAGIGAEAGYRGRADDGARRIRFRRRGDLHRWSSILDGEEYARQSRKPAEPELVKG